MFFSIRDGRCLWMGDQEGLTDVGIETVWVKVGERKRAWHIRAKLKGMDFTTS